MLRRIAAGGLAATLFLVVLAGCGGSEASGSPSASPAAGSAAAPTAAPTQGTASSAPTVAPPSAPAGDKQRMLATCAGVAVRKGPTMTDVVLVRVAKLTKVRVVGTVTGDPYDGGTCGTSGAGWIKIDRINGTSVKKLYGVPFGYAAAGFFQ